MMKRIIPYILIAFCISTAYAGYDRVIGPGEYEYSIVEWTSGLLLIDGGGGIRFHIKDSSNLEVLSTSTPLGLDVGGIQYIWMDNYSALNYSVVRHLFLHYSKMQQPRLAVGELTLLSLQRSNETKHITMICDIDSVHYNATTRLLTGNWLGNKVRFRLLVNDDPERLIQLFQIFSSSRTGQFGFTVRRMAVTQQKRCHALIKIV